ncbi:tRNA uridine(34) hydroxylase-like [Podarcis lilfordi]|uniref:tRNA uridine(34) hydroxylase-like n=1 Tax=Podarcis lilfordi TaxID=74358 RepID=A0AA35LG29_9SAUR|nr:tRNA uridine(34) hydroxylase-like [Podarcis lilfordi]
MMADQLLKEIEAAGITDLSEKRSLVIKWVKGLFPGVEVVTTETLQQWMKEKPEELIILDTRTSAEFDVSHLPGAILVPPEADALLEFFKTRLAPGREEEGPSKPIICYCTVGYRSSMAAELLGSYFSREAGKTCMASPKIYNVCGGLVAWAVERRQMVDKQERPTSVVHPYSPTWAKLLEPEFRAEI